eukprot:gene2177-17768_t
MELEDRTFSIGTCEREFEKIQQALQGISNDIDVKLSEPNKNTNQEKSDQDEPSNSEDLNALLDCNEDTFALKIRKMKIVDLDMVIIVFEQQIKIEQALKREDIQGAKKRLTEMRERLTRCYMKKAELVKCEGRPFEGDKYLSKTNSKSASSSSMDSSQDGNIEAVEDINSLSVSELQSLLFYNGLNYNPDDSKATLIQLVKARLLDDNDDDGFSDDWEPPGDEEFNWKSAIKDSETGSSNAKENKGDESADLMPKDELQTIESTTIQKPEVGTGDGPITSTITDLAEKLEMEETSDIKPPLASANPESELKQEEKGSLESEATGGISVTMEKKMSLNDRADSYESDPEDLLSAKREEGSVMDWDPRCLLRDLYFVLQRSEPVNFEKKEAKQQAASNTDRCKMDGYLEKLPVNHTKATLLKGWKKRYFKVSHGKLFYFENHLATVPLGSLTLTGSELKVTGDKTIQIQSQSNRNIITLRCSTSNESNDWYRVLKQESAISIPLTAPVKVPLQLEQPTSHVIIIDLGASTIKGGFAGEEKPRVVFPAVYAVNTDRKNGRRFTDSGIPDPATCTCGFDAFKPEIRRKSKLIYPLRPTLKVDKFAVKSRYIPGFIDKVIQELKVDPSHYTIILCCQRHFSDKDKEFIFDHLFGHLGVSAVYAQQQALLSLFSYKDTTGVIARISSFLATSGTFKSVHVPVDIGDHVDVFPVIEGVIIENGSSSLPQGGQLITEHLSRLLSEGGYRFFSEVESYIVRYIKEKSAYVSLDCQRELETELKGLDVDVARYDLPGKQRKVNVGTERFRCTEGLFDPNAWGKDYEGIHKLVAKAIKQSGIDQRKEMCRKIFLSGGTTLIEGPNNQKYWVVTALQ